MNRLVYLIVPLFLAACSSGGGGGGGGGGGNGGGIPPATYSLSGFVTSAVTGSPIQAVTLTLSGAASSTTTTDGTGSYTFTGLANGSYTVTASLQDALFAPNALGITISGANSTANDFLGVRGEVFTGIEFMPASFLSSQQLRVSLHTADGNLIYTDSSDTPLKKQPLDGSPAVALADRFSSAENVVLHDGKVYWIEGGDLHTMVAGGNLVMLADGLRAAEADVTADIVVDATHVYWVDQAPEQVCSPPCNWLIRKVPLAGGDAVTLATADRRIDSLAADANSIFWEEGSLEPWAEDCNCGSKIKSVPKSGGAAVLLVDGSLNGALPPPPPGHIPASWYPTGGIALSASDVIFARTVNDAYELKSVPKSGGLITNIASVASTAGYARNSVLDITVVGDAAYWVDTANADVKSVPLAAGPVSTLATGLVNPGGLAANSSKVFWTEAGAYVGCCLAMGAGSVRSVAIAGGKAQTVAGSLDAPVKVSADEVQVAWTEFWRIADIAAAGGNAATRISGIAGNLARIAVSQSRVFVLDGALIKVVPVAGGKLEKLSPATSGAISDFSQRSGDIAADTDNVYWTMLPVLGAPVIRKVPVAGGVPVVLASQGIIPNPQDCFWRIAVDQQSVYWSEGSTDYGVGCAVKSVPIAGGAVTELFDQPYVADFTVDGVNVYYSEFVGNTIQKVPVDGGANMLAASGVVAAVLGNDADNLYWLDPRVLMPDNFGLISKTAGPADWIMLPIPILMDPLLVLDGFTLDDNGLAISEATTGTLYRIF